MSLTADELNQLEQDIIEALAQTYFIFRAKQERKDKGYKDYGQGPPITKTEGSRARALMQQLQARYHRLAEATNSSTITERRNDLNDVRDIALEIYDKEWNVNENTDEERARTNVEHSTARAMTFIEDEFVPEETESLEETVYDVFLSDIEELKEELDQVVQQTERQKTRTSRH